MKKKHGYAITFSLVADTGVDGEKIYSSSYPIRDVHMGRVEPIQRSVHRESEHPVPNQAQRSSNRSLSSEVTCRERLNYQSTWCAS